MRESGKNSKQACAKPGFPLRIMENRLGARTERTRILPAVLPRKPSFCGLHIRGWLHFNDLLKSGPVMSVICGERDEKGEATQ